MLQKHKISFIVIGKNQERTIVSCIQSILSTTSNLKIKSYEIIYVDSMSSDRSIEVIKDNFKDKVSIYRLYVYMNAAIGRNIGASKSSGDVLFFIDGDMEIEAAFLPKVYSESEGLKYDFVSGDLREHLYDQHWIKTGERKSRYNVNKKVYQSSVGGVFLIKRELFDKVQGFRNYMRINEDIDFALRLSEHGVFLLRIPVTIALHKTFEFNKMSNVFKRLMKGDLLYSGLLLREHFLNKYFYREFIDREKFTLLLLITVGLSFLVNIGFILIYPIAILVKQIKTSSNNYLGILVGKFLDSIVFITGIFFFFKKPIQESHIKYEKMV
ncbi:glycosyltransferase family 2 protein [Clostridium lacusfryxellense]|uniref:glycosyltransferase family 2 protein n=1 Tax=Clostridium lacusfryxellense TaxID=205328 RepID=UPI001C0D173E|nr:glycosyltransferase [Clostridium lacusfryxellense]MBU3111049.1 glycosyltransferase [Clostridium lacusfryxellense]